MTNNEDQTLTCNTHIEQRKSLTKSIHETPRNQRIAEENTILLTQVGSGLHGVTVANTDDRDEMGVCIEPPECVIGLETFEQYQFRTQPEGVRSGFGDLDLVIYSLRKWTRLAAQGNPTVLMLLFAPPQELVKVNDWGHNLRANADMFLSRDAGFRFKGYLQSQKEKLIGERSQRTNRPELIEQYGFDCKFAFHAIRLALQGIELLTTGHIQLPMAEPAHTWLSKLRIGEYSLQEALEHLEDLQYILQHLAMNSPLPRKPDYARINKWLVEAYASWWDSQNLTQ